MPTTLDLLKDAFTRAIRGQFPGLAADIYDAAVPVVPTTNPVFGDYQCNAAMALAKCIGQKPRDVATALVTAIGNLDGLAEKVDIAGPGFINITLSKPWIEGKLAILTADKRLGISLAPSPATIVVDYSGPNIAKEMHVGHLRSTIIGDAVARVLKFQDHAVIRQNHLGDWGTQFGMLIEYTLVTAHDSALKDVASSNWELEQGDNFAFSFDLEIKDLEDFYRAAKVKFDSDPTFQVKARHRVVQLQQGHVPTRHVWMLIVRASRKHFAALYRKLGVDLNEDSERGESTYNVGLPGVVADLESKQLATESEGAIAVFIDGEKKPPLIIQKSGGGYLYGTTDLAAIRYRVDTLQASRILYFVDSRQAQHFSQVFRTAKAAGWADGVSLEHAAFGTILGKDGKPFKTRSGDTVKLKDLLDEAVIRARAVVDQKNADLPDDQKAAIAKAIGIGAVKYADLSKDRTTDYIFDWETMLAMDGNTAPYLQYAHARIRSIFRKAAETYSPGAAITLDAPQELTLAKHLLRLGEVIDDVARDLKPHVLCQYLYELATKFSGFYEHCPVLKSDEPTRSSRLALCDLTARTLALGLDLLGIEHPEQM